MGNTASAVQATIHVEPVVQLTAPDLLSESRILTEEQIVELYQSMPCRLQSQPWRLTFSTNEHGYSLMTMFRLMENVEGPVLVVVKDFQGTIFGVLTSDPLLIQPRWYGRSESFLYSFKPDLRTYGPTFANENCIFASPSYLMFGGSKNGMTGLYIGDDFCDGSSFMCDTYGNKPLSKNEDFLIRSVEMWSFFEKW